MNLPWYGCSRCTCFVRTCSGSARSDHESSRSSAAYSSSWVTATGLATSLARQELLAERNVRCRPREPRVRLFRVRSRLLHAGRMLQRRLVARVEDHVGTNPVPDGQHEREPFPGADDRVRRVGRTVEVVPLLQRHLLALDDQQALAAEDEKTLLVRLLVVHRHRLAGLQRRQVDAEFREPFLVLVELARRAELVLLPAELPDALDPPTHSGDSTVWC